MSDTFDHGGNIFTTARSLGVPPELLLDFSASINPLGFASGVRDAVVSAFDRVLHYPDTDSVDLKQALADYHGVDPTQLLMANGSTELIYLIPRLMQSGRGLIVAPAFSEYAKALSHAGIEVEYLRLSPEDDFSFPFATLEKTLAAGRFQVMFLCNPGNPTGALLQQAEVQRILDLCCSTGVFLVVDEAFMDFCEGKSAKDIVPIVDNAIVLRSMTKFFAIPGLRAGYALASPSVINNLEWLRGPWSVNTLAQIAGVASLADAGYVLRTVRYVEEERAFLSAELARIDGLQPYPSAANYLLVRVTERYSAEDLRQKLLKQLILVRECSNFTGLGNAFFRVAVRKHEENVKLVAALRELFRSR